MTIAVNLSPEFGERLWELARRGPVWIVNSTVNDPVIREFWEHAKESSEDSDVTSFRSSHDFLALLDTIILHHPEWTALEIHGVLCDSEVRVALESLGAGSVEETPEFFVARSDAIQFSR